MLAGGPVHPIGDSGFYAVCGWDAVNDVIARPEDFSSNLTATMTYQGGKVGAFRWANSAGHPSAGNCRRPRPCCAPKVVGATIGGEANPCTGVVRRRDRGSPVERRRARRRHRMDVGDGQSTADDDRQDDSSASPTRTSTSWCGGDTRAPKWLRGLSARKNSPPRASRAMELAGYIIDHFPGGRRSAGQSAQRPRNGLRLRRIGGVTALTMMITLFSAGGESTASLIGSAAHILADRPDIQQRVRENPDLLAHSSKRCCGTSRRSVAIIAMFSTTPRCAASICAPDHAFCCCGVRPTGTRHISTIPTTFRLDRARRQGPHQLR